jgi:ketosteroid isomerase-like protein
MSQEKNVEIARQLFQWVSAKQDLNRDLLHPDFKFDATEIAPDTGGPLGLEAALEFLHAYWATFDEFRAEIETVIHADETRVLVHVRDEGRVKGTDSEMTAFRFEALTLRDGKVVRVSIHTDRRQALEAVGLSE